MVGGLDKFRERVARFSDNYVIIGGTACDVILRDTEMRLSATMDIDIVVIVEKNFGFKIKAEEMAGVDTFSKFCDYIEKKIS